MFLDAFKNFHMLPPCTKPLNFQSIYSGSKFQKFASICNGIRSQKRLCISASCMILFFILPKWRLFFIKWRYILQQMKIMHCWYRRQWSLHVFMPRIQPEYIRKKKEKFGLGGTKYLPFIWLGTVVNFRSLYTSKYNISSIASIFFTNESMY